ncbi:hypothetical protein MNB_SV-15-1593 [hydrothermal vent metagenome]|uniref:Uncharacterized protein n=1 Tax=hydrothermal vent metagenome TaxID=652676 RepID=A0A1W1EK06_9ZZZZ
MKKNKLIAIFLLSIFMISCGSLSDGEVDAKDLGTAYYNGIEGVEFDCGDAPKGTTDSRGKIIFEKGEGCKLFIGSKSLREISSSALTDGITLVELNDANIQFLQTLDNDGDASNGIKIISGVADYFDTQSVLEGLLPSFFTDLFTVNRATMATLSTALELVSGYNGNSVDLDDAKMSVKDMIDNLEANNIEYRILY